MPTPPITTTAHDTFTGHESEQLAALILKRFGWDNAAAAAAWRRLLENSCTDVQFAELAAGATSEVRRGLR